MAPKGKGVKKADKQVKGGLKGPSKARQQEKKNKKLMKDIDKEMEKLQRQREKLARLQEAAVKCGVNRRKAHDSDDDESSSSSGSDSDEESYDESPKPPMQHGHYGPCDVYCPEYPPDLRIRAEMGEWTPMYYQG
jgi:hypothetical protein